jgi:hypothetical protein
MSMDYPPPPPRDPPAPPTYPLPTSNVQPVAPPIPYQPPPPPTYQPVPPPPGYGQPALYAWRLPKSKTAAVLFAIFLGYFAWMYTYEKDAWKFWTALAVTVVNVLLSLITFGVWLFVAIPVAVGIWVWGIIDVAVKPQQFYDLYPAA